MDEFDYYWSKEVSQLFIFLGKIFTFNLVAFIFVLFFAFG